jgi:hypothetical protein
MLSEDCAERIHDENQSLKALDDMCILKHLDLHNTESDLTFLRVHVDGKFCRKNMQKDFVMKTGNEDPRHCSHF